MPSFSKQRGAESALTKALKDPDVDMRYHATWALGETEPADAAV